MTHLELYNRIALAVECPPFRIDWERRNGYVWCKAGYVSGTIGVATALVGFDANNDFRVLDRSFRAEMLGWEWSYLLHFEQAINALIRGEVRFYNSTGLFPFVELSALPASDENLRWVKYALLSNLKTSI